MFQRHLWSDRRQTFWRHLRQTYVLSVHDLVRIARDQVYTARFRAAALRNLVCTAPIEVTQGRPYACRRQLVRKHYQV